MSATGTSRAIISARGASVHVRARAGGLHAAVRHVLLNGPTGEEIARSITAKAAATNYRVSRHAEKERHRDQITMEEIATALATPEVIENYPNDPRGHSCLVLGWTLEQRPLHLVLGDLFGEVPLVIITLYRPDPAQWIDWRTRR